MFLHMLYSVLDLWFGFIVALCRVIDGTNE